MAFRAHVAEHIEDRALRWVDQHVRAEASRRQFATIGLEIGNDDRLDSAGGQGRHRRQTDGARADHDRDLPRLESGRPYVELADRECVDDGDGVARYRSLDDLRRRLGHNEQLAEAALRFGMLTDDAQTADASVDQPDRHRRDARTDRERIAASGTVADDLAHELVPHHNVAVGVVQRPPCGVVDRELGVVHEMDVRGADRRAERLQQKVALAGNGIGGLPDLQPAASQYDCAQDHSFLYYSR